VKAFRNRTDPGSRVFRTGQKQRCTNRSGGRPREPRGFLPRRGSRHRLRLPRPVRSTYSPTRRRWVLAPGAARRWPLAAESGIDWQPVGGGGGTGSQTSIFSGGTLVQRQVECASGTVPYTALTAAATSQENHDPDGHSRECAMGPGAGQRDYAVRRNTHLVGFDGPAGGQQQYRDERCFPALEGIGRDANYWSTRPIPPQVVGTYSIVAELLLGTAISGMGPQQFHRRRGELGGVRLCGSLAHCYLCAATMVAQQPIAVGPDQSAGAGPGIAKFFDWYNGTASGCSGDSTHLCVGHTLNGDTYYGRRGCRCKRPARDQRITGGGDDQ